MSFIHKEILSDPMLEKIGDSFVHKQIGTCIFFHNRVIDRWRREIEFVSGSFNDYQSKQLQKRHHDIRKITYLSSSMTSRGIVKTSLVDCTFRCMMPTFCCQDFDCSLYSCLRR